MNELRDYIAGVDTQVPTANGLQPYANLDNAATTPAFKTVLAAVNEFAPLYSSVHRGSGFKSRVSTDVYEQCRDVVMSFVGANTNEHTVIFGKNTTEAVNKLSYRLGLQRKDIVLISHLEHHSNDLPWRSKATVQRIATSSDGSVDQGDFLKLLKEYGPRIKLVAISGASNVTGHMPDIHWFASQTHAIGAQIFVDCAQLAAHRQIDMKPLDDPTHLDYIAFSGHKMYAPFGCGVLVARRDIFVGGNPEYVGGGTIASVTTDTIDWATPPERDEAGSPNVIGAVTLARAIRTLQKIGLDTIAQHERQMTAYTLDKLKTIPDLILYGSRTMTANRSGVIAFALGDIPSHLVAAQLGFEWGIGVRSGCFCAQPYVMSLLGLNPSRVRRNILRGKRSIVPGLVRVSFGIYNTTAEIDRLTEALLSISRRHTAHYTVDDQTGIYTPTRSALYTSSDRFAI